MKESELYIALHAANEALRDATRHIEKSDDAQSLARCHVCRSWVIEEIIKESARQHAKKPPTK